MTIDGADWAPDSCSLPSAERPLRVAEFDALFQESVLGSARISSTRLEVTLVSGAEIAARDLATRESGCCSFFTFEFDTRPSEVVMGIAVPHSQVAVLDALAAQVATVREEGEP